MYPATAFTGGYRLHIIHSALACKLNQDQALRQGFAVPALQLARATGIYCIKGPRAAGASPVSAVRHSRSRVVAEQSIHRHH